MNNHEEQPPRIKIIRRSNPNETDDSVEPRIRIRQEVQAAPEITPEAVAARLLAKPVVIHIYTNGADPAFNPVEMADYLRQTWGANFTVQYEGPVLKADTSGDQDQLTFNSEHLTALAEASFARQQVMRGLYQPVDLALREQFERAAAENIAEQTSSGSSRSFRDFARHYQFKKSANRMQFDDPRRQTRDWDYYQADKLAEAYHRMLRPTLEEGSGEERHVAVVFTGRGIGNPEGHRGQVIHMRAGTMLGPVSVISTTGLVEAPAKPPEYQQLMGEFGWQYLHQIFPDKSTEIKQMLSMQGASGDQLENTVNELLKDKMLLHGDARLTAASKGIALQLLLYSFGEVYGTVAQCSTSNLYSHEADRTKTCRCHDAHLQEELVNAQTSTDHPEFCDFHTQLFGLLQAFCR